MANWTLINPRLGVPQIDEVITSLPTGMALGDEVQARSNTYGVGTFVLLKGATDLAVGSSVTINRDDGSVTLLAANAKGPVGFAMAAATASEYCFYQRVGKAVGKVLTSFADNGDCYATSTAGSIDDAVVAGDLIFNCKGASAIGTPSTGLAELEIDRPFVKDGLDDAIE